jgi:hypothetical protein
MTAIEQTRMIRFLYHGREPIAEPHDHGVLNGTVQLLSYQTDGVSSRPLPNWLLTKVDEISELSLLRHVSTTLRQPAWEFSDFLARSLSGPAC